MVIKINLFFSTFSNFVIFFVLFIIGSAWAYHCFKKGHKYVLTPAICISLLLLVIWGMIAGIDVDEIEHLHCTWMVYSGFVPFKDFWQHHAPIFWVILAPIFGILKPSVSVIALSRIFSAFIFVLIVFAGWKVAQKAWQGQARLSVYLLIAFVSSVVGDFLCFRPDLFTTLFLLLFIYLCLEIPGRKLSPSFFAGVAFGIAASFLFKQYLLFFLPFFIILKEKSGLRIAKSSAYLLGVCCGVLPLMLYLFDKGIVREFVFWVFAYNRKRIVFSVDFPVAIGAVGVYGVYLLLRRYRDFRDSGALILFIAFCLSTISSFTHTLTPFYNYNIGLWFMLCAVTGSGRSLYDLTGRLSSLCQKSLAAGLFLSLILSLSIVAVGSHKNTYFSTDKKIVSQLITYSAQDTCLAILPYHPVFATDVSRLYAFWQFHLSDRYPEVRDDIIGRGIAKEIMRIKPAVVLFHLNGRDFLLDLFQKRLISKTDYNNMIIFFKSGYTLKDIEGNKYFIRNDKL
ncbi:MAG: hypothetical protein V1893_01620 [Candidatus Omnitrophota bacterium]